MADQPGLQGPIGVQKAVTVQKAWDNLMSRIGIYTPKLVQYGATNLQHVDNITGMHSNRLPI